jgi:transposase
MSRIDLPQPIPAASQAQNTTLFVALELSRKSWLVALSAPGEDKISKFVRPASDGPGLVQFLQEQRAKVEARIGHRISVRIIQEAGLDGFWLHRLLEANGFISQVVDPASIAVDRRARRRKTDRLDLDGLMRTLMAWSRGERGVCSMVRPPTPEQEDRRRLTREREELITERTRHINRIKGLLAGQGIVDFEPLRTRHRTRLDVLRTGDGRLLPPHLKQEIRRHLARLDLVQSDIQAVEAERDALLGRAVPAHTSSVATKRPCLRRSCCSSSKALVRKARRYCGWRFSFVTSPIAAKSPVMLAWPRRRGTVAASSAIRASVKPAIRMCARS